MMDGKQRQLQTVGDADLVVHVAQIILDYLFCGTELRSDFFVLVSLHDQCDDAQFFGGQAVPHPQANHIVFGQLAGDGDVLYPGLAACYLAHAVH